MFGRVRASPSPSPLDSLETPPSKIIKDDSLSIYEATLMRLKLGSQRRMVSPPPVTESEIDSASGTVSETTIDLRSAAMKVVEAASSTGTVSNSCQDVSSDEGVNMLMDAKCSSVSVSNSSSDHQSAGNWNSQHQTKNVSILYMFTKYTGYKHDRVIGYDEMMIENDGSASSSSSECQSLICSKEQGKQESSCCSFSGLC